MDKKSTHQRGKSSNDNNINSTGDYHSKPPPVENSVRSPPLTYGVNNPLQPPTLNLNSSEQIDLSKYHDTEKIMEISPSGRYAKVI